MAIWFWTATDTSTSTKHILDIYKSQFEIEKNISSDYTDASLWYADVDTEEILIDDTGNIVDVNGNDIGEQAVDWADITATFDTLTDTLTITRSASIPVVLEIWNGLEWIAYKSWSAGTTDITIKLYHGGNFRVRRDWTSSLEASNIVEMIIGPYEKVGFGAFDDGTAGIKIDTKGQFQVGNISGGKFIRFGKYQIQGTVSGSAGSTTLTGTNTKFLSELRVGDVLLIKENEYTVSAIHTNTSLDLSSVLSEDLTDEVAYLKDTFVIRSDMRVAKDKNEIIFEDSGIRLRDSGYTAGTLYETLVEFVQEFFGAHSVKVKNTADTDGYNVYTYIIAESQNQFANGSVTMMANAENGDTESSARATAQLYFYVANPSGYGGNGEAFLGLKRVYVGGTSWYSEFFLNNVNWFKVPILILTDTSLLSNAPDGALAIDTNGNLRFKKNGTWYTVQLA